MKLNGVLDMKLVEKLIQNRILSKEEFVELLSNTSTEDREILRKEAVRLPVSYTHLTLPTNSHVYVSGGGGG